MPSMCSYIALIGFSEDDTPNTQRRGKAGGHVSDSESRLDR